MKLKHALPFAAVFIMPFALAPVAHAAQVVYEDTFDNDGLATNAGIGGGLAARTINTSTFDDNGNLVDTAGANNSNRGVLSSINSFNVANGFTLEVHMIGGTGAIAQSFGLSKTQFTADTSTEDWMREQSWAGEGTTADAYGIGVQTGSTNPGVSEPTPRGLKFNNGAADSTAITNLVTTTDNLLPAGTNTFVITVTPDDQFSYTYNGGTPVTGEIVAGAGSFDLSQPLFFNIYSQTDIEVSYVKITALPATGAPQLVNFSYDPADGSAAVDIKGAKSTNYKLVEADDLDFANPDQDPIPLTGTTVGTLDGNEVTTDGSGNATVQFNLGTTKSATFLRAQSVP